MYYKRNTGTILVRKSLMFWIGFSGHITQRANPLSRVSKIRWLLVPQKQCTNLATSSFLPLYS